MGAGMDRQVSPPHGGPDISASCAVPPALVLRCLDIADTVLGRSINVFLKGHTGIDARLNKRFRKGVAGAQM